MTSLKKLAIRATAWTVTSYGLSQIIRFISNIILTHLLFPKLFGLMALTYVFLTGLALFSDIGVGPSIIQSKRGDEPEFLNTAWTLQVIRGFGLWVACLIIAWPVADFYGDSKLLWLIPVVGLNSIISGFNSTSIFTLNRRMELGKLAVMQLMSQVVSIILTVLWACFNRTIWALIVGSFSASLITAIWSHLINPGAPNRLVWDKTAAQAIFSYGKWIFLSTVVTFFAEQIDRILLGKVLSLELLGVYGVAASISDIPRQVTLALNSNVIFPAVAKIADHPREAIRTKLIRNRRPILLLLLLLVVGMTSFGDIFILAVYDKRYIQAAWILPLLAIGIWPRVLCNTSEPSLFAIGKPQYSTVANFSRFIVTAAGIIIGFQLMKVPGAIIAVALNDFCFYAAVCYGLGREGLSCFVQDMKMTALLVGVLAVVLICRYALGFGFPLERMSYS